MQPKNRLKNKIKFFIFSLLFFAMIFFPIQKPAQAVDCWFIPCDEIFAQAMDILKQALQAILKQEGVQMIADAAGQAAKFVENPKAFLNTDPVKEVNKTFDKYLKEVMAQGKGGANYLNANLLLGSKSNYNDSNFEGVGPDSFRIGLYRNYSESTSFIETVSAAGSKSSGSSGSGNYISNMVESAKKATMAKVEPAVTYVGNPKEMFESKAKDGFKKMNEYASGINNPWAFTSYAESAYEKQVAEAKDFAKTNFIAGQGFLPTTDEKGNVKTPAITTKDIISDSKTVGNEMLANATNIPEAMVTMILTMASETISEGIKGGQKNSPDNTSKKEMLQKKMDDLAGKANMQDAMGEMTVQDIFAPSLLRKLFGEE